MYFYKVNSLILLSILGTSACFTESCLAEPIFSNYLDACYQPYIQLGGHYYFHYPSRAAGEINIFLPLLQTINQSHLLFTQLRTLDGSGKPFAGNVHLGYRYLSPDQQYLLGFYSSFDRKRSSHGKYFNQLTFGTEAWIKQFFIGLNYYRPIGKQRQMISLTENHLARIQKNEIALTGGDCEIGYEFPYGITLYTGGFYFTAPHTTSLSGPKARIKYTYTFESCIPCNNLELEAGYSHDHVRGSIYHLSLSLRFGPKSRQVTQGVAKHMVDLISCNSDILINLGEQTSVSLNAPQSTRYAATRGNTETEMPTPAQENSDSINPERNVQPTLRSTPVASSKSYTVTDEMHKFDAPKQPEVNTVTGENAETTDSNPATEELNTKLNQSSKTDSTTTTSKAKTFVKNIKWFNL